MKNIYMIANTHFDPVWLWKWEEAMMSIHATFRSALDIMKDDPDFIYSFATPPVFEWIKKIDPEMFSEIKTRVSEGRWEICEGWYLQPDCFSGCGESYARQSLYGQRYLLENFGKYSQAIFNIDSFGHNSATPQIMKKSHIKYYCMCRPESYHFAIETPYFNWAGKDGSTVRAFRAGQRAEIYNKNMVKAVEAAEAKMTDSDCDELMVYGVTDHGGAPTRKAVSDIHTLNAQKPYELKFSTVSDYFEAQGEPKMRVCGEMITKDFGVYTNNHIIKKRNRLAEYSALNAEKASVFAKKLLGVPYNKQKLCEIWKDIMFNQFHDILGGACIKEAYSDAYDQQGRAIFTANEIMHYTLGRITKNIKTPGKNPDDPWNIVVWNLNDSEYEGTLEAEVQWLHEFDAYSGGITLEDSDGKAYPCQIMLERSVISGFRSRFIFDAKIPPMGYKSFKVIKNNQTAVKVYDKDNLLIKTSTFEAEIGTQSGLIESISFPKIGKTFKNILRPAFFEDAGDTWCFNTDGYGKELEAPVLENIRVIERGIHRTTVKASFRFRNTLFSLYYTFYEKYGYFDVRYTANINEPHIVMKLISDTGYDNITVSSPFGTEVRDDCSYDSPMGEWVCMHCEDGGVSFIADSLFSYTKKQSVLALSAARSCIYGDLRLDELDEEADYPIMEQGICEGRLRIAIHSGTAFDNGIPHLANSFNNAPIVICDSNHDGALPPTDSFITLEARSVSLCTVKEHEDNADEVLRLFEYAGFAQTVSLTYFGTKYTIDIAPFEIKTLKITNGKAVEILITEDVL